MMICLYILVAIGLLSALCFNLAYFTYVLPHARAKGGPQAYLRAGLALVAGQIKDYCRDAQIGESKQRLTVAIVIRVSAIGAIAAFVGLIAIGFWDVLAGW